MQDTVRRSGIRDSTRNSFYGKYVEIKVRKTEMFCSLKQRSRIKLSLLLIFNEDEEHLGE